VCPLEWFHCGHFSRGNDLPFFANLFDLDRRKLNDSGSLLYIPYSPMFVDLFDVKHGQQQLRVVLKEQLKNVWTT